MVWFFSRDNALVRLETTYENATRDYVLEIAWPDRPVETRRFQDLAAFQSALTRLEAQLAADRWRQQGDPEILLTGWRGPTTN